MSELQFHEYCEVKKPKYLVVFLHGYGANGINLLDLAYEFRATLPEAHFISPNGIQPWEGGFPDAYQWFSLESGLNGLDLNVMAQEIRNSNKILEDFINHQLERFDLKPENLFIIGFSQGAMMALYQGLIQDRKAAGIIAFSGKLVLPEAIGQKTLSKPEICLIHGEKDHIVPFANFVDAKKTLEKEQIPFESHAISNLEHSIDMNGVQAAKNFIKKQQKHI